MCNLDGLKTIFSVVKSEKTQTFSKYKNDENSSQILKSKNSRKEFVPVYKKYGTLQTLHCVTFHCLQFLDYTASW